MAKAIEIAEKTLGEGDDAKNIRVLTLTTANLGALAAMVWASLPGKTIAEKQEQEQKLYDMIRSERKAETDANKRPRKTEEQVVRESVGKALADLQTAMVTVASVRMRIGDVLRVASDKTSPLQPSAETFLNKHNLVAVEKKETSKGKARIYLMYKDASKVPEGTDTKLIAKSAKEPEATPAEVSQAVEGAQAA